MEVADPYGAVVKGQVLSAGNYVGMNIPAMTATGEYTVKMNLVATNGKYWDETYKFVLMKAGPLSKSAEIWNNPVKLGNPK